MPDQEPEAQLQATASLSPVSPSPVHTAAPLVVPALQNTVDTIDAMVAAAITPSDPAEASISDADAVVVDEDDHVVDNESFDDAYNNQEESLQPTTNAPVEPLPDSDDYAKTFDSPLDSEEGDDETFEQAEGGSPGSPEAHAALGDPRATDGSFQHASEDEGHSTLADENLPPGALAAAATDQIQNDVKADAARRLSPTSLAGSNLSNVDVETHSAETMTSGAPSVVPNGDPAGSNGQDLAKPPSEPHPSIVSLPSSSSLPPRPPQPIEASQSLPSQYHPGAPISNVSHNAAVSNTSSTHQTFTAPGTSGNVADILPGYPSVSSLNPSINPSPFQTPSAGRPVDQYSNDYSQRWEQFLEDERQYMSEAKWDRFPEGSRIFIGNLSSDKVSKRDVFDEFHKFGRLAQISLKSAYGFVQYHTVDEGRRAIEEMRDAEIKGRRIQLEISKVQDKSKKDRNQSPNRNRGRDGGHQNERYGNPRDNFNRGRDQSPRRSDAASSYGVGRSRGRSRSPTYGRNDRDSYRQRSRSPQERHRRGEELDLPRRYGADVPDVQIILQPDVDRQFVGWVESTFKGKGLKTEVMFLHPRIPKDQVIQRQAVEGVHAVVDLDARVHYSHKIPVQAFDRSGGSNNVRFDQYVDLDPSTAADVILRAKASAVKTYPQPSYNITPAGYPQYGGGQHPQAPHHNQYPGIYPPQQQYQPQQPQANPGDLRSLLGHLDDRTMQQLLANSQPQHSYGAPAPAPAYGAQPTNPQVDVNALLASLSGGKPTNYQNGPPHGQYGQPYPQAPPRQNQPPAGDEAEHVRNALGLLAKFR